MRRHHLICALQCLGCSSENPPRAALEAAKTPPAEIAAVFRDIELRFPGADALSPRIALNGKAGQRDGESWIFDDLPLGDHRLSVSVEGCPEQTDEITLQKGDGVHVHPFVLACEGEFMGQVFRLIPPGEFQMGSEADEAGRQADETRHAVALSRPFWIATTETTQSLYAEIMGALPSQQPGDCSLVGNAAVPAPEQPVYCIDWYEALAFANALSEREGLRPCYQILTKTAAWKKDCAGYRLPTEAEWEYAARAGQNHAFAGSDDAEGVAWHKGNSGGRSHAVARKKANAWGLFDMSGNLWEWVWDAHAPYPETKQVDPRGPLTGPYRSMRGGCWAKEASKARIADRVDFVPFIKMDVTGLRLVREYGE